MDCSHALALPPYGVTGCLTCATFVISLADLKLFSSRSDELHMYSQKCWSDSMLTKTAALQAS